MKFSSLVNACVVVTGVLALCCSVGCGKADATSGGGAGADDTAGSGAVSGDSAGAGGKSAGSGGKGSAGAGGGRDVTELTRAAKLDLLFMVDNSVSMADKEGILAESVPYLLSRLIDPICVDESGAPSKGTQSTGCASGSNPQFAPLGDIHLAIVSSSLGAHGGSVCATGAATDNLDDKAHLIGASRPFPGGVANPTAALNFNPARTSEGLGFLAWDPAGTKGGNIHNADTLLTAFQDMVVATGEHGCSFEAQLESWYRFLVDPEPPTTVTLVSGATVRSSRLTVKPDGTPGECTGCDDVLLAQRKAFLRPDSAVAIVMLTDENDCSIRDDGVGWFIGASARMPRSTAICDANPNDPCCRSCAQREMQPPAGCKALTADASCANVPAGQQYATYDALHDSINLRCFKHRERFGFDLLYETQRYVDALSSRELALQSDPAASVVNPLYAGEGTRRSPSLVFLEGIVGVPWQDLADDASQTGPGLTYLTAKDLLAKDRWSAMLGTSTGLEAPVPPSDPFMIEASTPRAGTNNIAQPPVSIVPATSMDPHANVINGHEQQIPGLDDLQYACTFPLKTPKVCADGDSTCDCSADKNGNSDSLTQSNTPLCQGGSTINTQTSGRAYPGTRELQVLKDYGQNAIVASICPKVPAAAAPAGDASYGYNPAIAALVDRLQYALKQ